MTPASDAARSPDRQTPLEVVAHFSGALGRATDLPEQLRLTADVLRRVMGDVSVTYFTLKADRWQPAMWEGHRPSAAGPAADSPTLIRVFEDQHPVFFDEGRQQGLGQGAVGLTQGGALYPYSRESHSCGLLRVALPAGRGWTVEERALYRALAFQPFFQGETMTGMLIVASRHQGRWPARERAVFRAVGRGLGLALERAKAVRRLARSNAKLQVAVDELEAFASSVSHGLRTPVRHSRASTPCCAPGSRILRTSRPAIIWA